MNKHFEHIFIKNKEKSGKKQEKFSNDFLKSKHKITSIMSMSNSLKLISRFQKSYDKKIESELLSQYYLPACNYANKHLSSITYSNLIKYERAEIESYVYIAFRKALKTYRCSDANSLSFKNYFYQMIKYETIKELKNNFNWQTIPEYAKICKEFNDVDCKNYEIKYIKEIHAKEASEMILKYLQTKKGIYWKIWQLKSCGLDNRDISKILKIDANQIKSKCQYIKKLLLKKYPELTDLF